MLLSRYITALLLLFSGFSAAAQDSTGLPGLRGAEKLFDLQFTPVKEDSILSGLADHLFYRTIKEIRARAALRDRAQRR